MKRLAFALLLLSCAVHTATAQGTIFLVRHAEKAQANSSKPDDPELSEPGQLRAESLRNMLKDAALTAIFATEFKRTQQTASAVASAAGIPLEIVPAKDTPALIEKLKGIRGNALVVGHSNTIPEVIRALGVSVPITIEDSAYDNLFIVTTGSSPQFIRLHYR